MLPPSLSKQLRSSDDVGTQLAILERFVDYLFCEPLTVGCIYGSRDLDELCQQLGSRNLDTCGIAAPPDSTSDVAVYIATKLQASGGHTAALLDVIRLSPKRRSIILVTGVCGSTDYQAIKRRISEVSDVELVKVPSGGHLQKLTWIQVYLQNIKPSVVWLFNHHQDSVAIAAVQPNRGYHLNYYHHGDDRLCLGVCLEFGSHYDVSPINYSRCKDNVGLKNNKYLPLTAVDFTVVYSAVEKESTCLVTCTAAGFNKIEVDYFVQYADVIPQVLSITGGKHIHIGRLTLIARWRILRLMRHLGVPENSFVYIPHVHSVWRALQDYQVDLYIASFPYGGGKTMVEVMGAGVPIIIHKNIADRMVGGFDMVYDGASSWRDPNELYLLLSQIDQQFIDKQRTLARAWYEKYHAPEILRALLAKTDASVESPLPKLNYESDPLLRACQVASEVSIVGILKRKLWRAYRGVKSKIGRHCSCILM